MFPNLYDITILLETTRYLFGNLDEGNDNIPSVFDIPGWERHMTYHIHMEYKLATQYNTLPAFLLGKWDNLGEYS